LPCRHLAVCSECAEKIRYQQAACPICRKPFKALLKLEISAKNNPTDESFSGKALLYSFTQFHKIETVSKLVVSYYCSKYLKSFIRNDK